MVQVKTSSCSKATEQLTEAYIESIIASWYRVITPEHLAALVESMPRRCQAVIDAKGLTTRYSGDVKFDVSQVMTTTV